MSALTPTLFQREREKPNAAETIKRLGGVRRS
jgi:hypothetical protein